MMQGVMMEHSYIGYIERLPIGKYRAQSTINGMSHIQDTYWTALDVLVTQAEKSGITGTLRTPEHMMDLR